MGISMLAYLLSGSLNNLFCMFCWYKLLGEKIPWKSCKFYLVLLILSILGTFVNFMLPQYLKIILMILLLFISNLVLLNRNLNSTIITVSISEFIVMICEVVFVFLVIPFAGDSAETLQNSFAGILVINLGICCLSFSTLLTPFPYRLYDLLSKAFNNVHNNILIINFLVTVLLAVLLTVMGWMNFPKYLVLLLNTFLIIAYVAIIIKLVITEQRYKKISNKYETSLTSLREYEDIMDKYRVDNHENKNQLLTIRNMVKAKDKTVIKYIDKLVDNKITDNENIFYTTSKIPEGGLRATIYSKLCKMKDANIDYTLDIANDVRTVDLIKLGDDTTLNICKIFGVFLDNAIEAVEKLDEKDIIIEIFIMDNDLYIEISNNYEEEIALEKIDNKGYTTKGKGHGYGLSLVREIIKNDCNLENEKKIDRDMFTQSLKIKM